MPRNVSDSIEIRGRILARELVQPDTPCSRSTSRARLVESDVTRPADPENLQIDPARLPDRALVGFTIRRDFPRGNHTIRDMDVFRKDIHMGEEIPIHESSITPGMISAEPFIFIEIERDDIRERQILLPVETDQFRIERQGRASGREPENRMTSFARPPMDQISDPAGQLADGCLR